MPNMEITIETINTPPHPIRNLPSKFVLGSLENTPKIKKNMHTKRSVIVKFYAKI